MSNPVIIVTGASKGIGLAVARILVSDFKARIVTVSRSVSEELQQLRDSAPNQVTIIKGNVAEAEVIKSTVSSALSVYGQLDGLVLNAGTVFPITRILSSSLTEEESLQGWRTVFDVNFFSLVQTLQCAIPHLRASKGRVVFVSSGSSTGGVAAWGPYSASKAAVNSLCRTLANEEEDITAVAIRPGAVDTEMQSDIRAQGSDHMLAKELARFTGLHETGTLVKPEDCGYPIAALAISATKELTGKYVSWDEEALKEFRRA